jgi:hypothetical protein
MWPLSRAAACLSRFKKAADINPYADNYDSLA